MTASAWIAIFGLMITVGLSIIAAVFWAGKVTAKLDILVKDSGDNKAEIKAFQKTCFTQTEAQAHQTEADHQRKQLWDSVKSLKRSVIKLMQKAGFDLSEEEL